MGTETVLLEKLAELRKNYARLLATCGTNHITPQTKKAYADKAKEISEQLREIKTN